MTKAPPGWPLPPHGWAPPPGWTVRISHGTVAGWTNAISGAPALMIATDTCALIDGYRDHRDRVVINRLIDGRYDSTDERRLMMPDGRPLMDHIPMVVR